MRRARVTNRDFNDPLAGRASCRQRRIARFGSLYEEWRTVLFELVFAPCYSVASTEYLAPVRSNRGFLLDCRATARGRVIIGGLCGTSCS